MIYAGHSLPVSPGKFQHHQLQWRIASPFLRSQRNAFHGCFENRLDAFLCQ